MVSSSAGAKRQHDPLIDVLRGFAALLASLSWHGFEKLWLRPARRPQATGAPDATAQPLRPLAASAAG